MSTHHHPIEAFPFELLVDILACCPTQLYCDVNYACIKSIFYDNHQVLQHEHRLYKNVQIFPYDHTQHASYCSNISPAHNNHNWNVSICDLSHLYWSAKRLHCGGNLIRSQWELKRGRRRRRWKKEWELFEFNFYKWISWLVLQILFNYYWTLDKRQSYIVWVIISDY